MGERRFDGVTPRALARAIFEADEIVASALPAFRAEWEHVAHNHDDMEKAAELVLRWLNGAPGDRQSALSMGERAACPGCSGLSWHRDESSQASLCSDCGYSRSDADVMVASDPKAL